MENKPSEVKLIPTPELIEAIHMFQQECPIIGKDSDNPFHKSKYASLEHIWEKIKPLLKKHGITVVQPPIQNQTFAGCRTLVFHSTGGCIASELLLPIPEKGLGAQGVGSCISYARRYSLTATLGIVVGDEDDDGEGAEGRESKSGGYRKATSEAKQPSEVDRRAARKASVLSYVRQEFSLKDEAIADWMSRVLKRKVEPSLALKTEEELTRLEDEVEKLKAMDAGTMQQYLLSPTRKV